MLKLQSVFTHFLEVPSDKWIFPVGGVFLAGFYIGDARYFAAGTFRRSSVAP